MATQESPNPRPRRTRRTRDEDDATSHPSEPVNTPQGGATAGQNEGAAQVPHQQPGGTPNVQAPDATMFAQLMQFMVQSQQQQQHEMREMMAQQLAFQQQLLSQQAQARLPQKKKGDPPTFKGNASEDLELWIFSTEQYYAQHREEMARNSSEFVDTIFANLGTVAQTWFRDFKLSLEPNQLATWELFKAKIRERFRDRDFEQKVLTKLHDLRWQGSQQEYTTKFLHLLSQLDEDLPDQVKRWMYQRNLRPETSSFISQNVPTTLQDTIELAQRFEDSRPYQATRKPDVKREAKSQQSSGDKKSAPQNGAEANLAATIAASPGTQLMCAVLASATARPLRRADGIKQKTERLGRAATYRAGTHGVC